MVRCVVRALWMTLICRSEAGRGSNNHKLESVHGWAHGLHIHLIETNSNSHVSERSHTCRTLLCPKAATKSSCCLRKWSVCERGEPRLRLKGLLLPAGEGPPRRDAPRGTGPHRTALSWDGGRPIIGVPRCPSSAAPNGVWWV